ncbi:hypothetical protein DL93DRAFT_2079368 [Clavulina sp. PMI_390]|nr:hypothetical protein DL93DRAFT_2079368 [Clavulina sp. PMI_390]
MSLFPYARAQTRLETLCGELWQLGYLFTTSSANPPQGFDRTLFPGLRWVHVSFDEDMMNEEFGTLMSLLKMSSSRQAPFLVFLGKNEWHWREGLRLSPNEDMRALHQHSSIVSEALWDPWKSDFDPKKVCASFQVRSLRICGNRYLSTGSWGQCWW